MSEATEQRQRADAVKQVLAMPGWEIIESELIGEANSVITKWKDSTDENLDRQYKADVRALDRLFNKIKSYAQIQT